MLSRLKHYRQILLPLYLIIAITIIGTIGYAVLCDYPLVDAFYMTIITIATVGYGEVHTLDNVGRLFTAFLIIVSFGTFAYAVASLTRFVLDGEFNKLFKIRKLNATIQKMSGHVIICGYGRNGRQAAQVLKKHKQRFIVIEKNPEITTSMQHQYSDLVITADSILDDTL